MKARRRSSSYRPHNWTYPVLVLAVHKENMSLEQLPVVVLSAIFNHLKTPDLLHVCVASKYFYLPAALQLYRRIVITNALLQSYAHQFLDHWDFNYGTAVTIDMLPRFVEVIVDNDKLALLVHTVIVTIEGDVPCLSQILLYSPVRELYYVGDQPLPQRLLNNVVSLTTSIRNSIIAPMLTELHICSGDDPVHGKYRMLALRMLENETYQNLRVLAFESTEDRNLHNMNQINASERQHAAWILFFAAFAELGIRLSLSRLILEGYMGDSGTKVASLLNKTVDLASLDLLALLCTELSHAHIPHYECHTTLLENITKYTQALTTLAISPTDDCLKCQVNSITEVLSTNLPGQLQNLLVTIESPNTTTSDKIKLVILQNQTNLAKLRFRDKTSQGGLKSELHLVLNRSQISEWEHGAFYNYRIRKGFFPNAFTFMGSLRFMSDPFVACICAKAQVIADVLKKDIVLRTAEQMTKLKEYELLDLTVNVPERCFLVNGMAVSYV